MHSAVKNALLAAALLLSGLGSGLAANKKILLIAGRPSHGPGDHEFRAGSLLLQKCLNKIKGIKAEVHDFGWPKDDAAFEGIDAVLIYADGGGGHRGHGGARREGARACKILDALKSEGKARTLGDDEAEASKLRAEYRTACEDLEARLAADRSKREADASTHYFEVYT